MFDIGITELGVIGVVALIVIGPEQLPRVAKTIGHLMGRLRRYVSDVKSDISREMEMADFKRMQEEIQSAASGFEQSMNQGISQLNEGAQELAAPLAEAAHELSGTHVATVHTEPAEVLEVEAPDADENQPDLFAAPEPQPEAATKNEDAR
jgi:sec-independent protein translocase protein TatB